MNAMLELAQAAIPDVGWTMLPNSEVWRHVSSKLVEQFNPINNSDQFCEVLAWLLSHGVESYDMMTDYERSPLFQNDGTPSGIRRVVVESALRVIEASNERPAV